MPYRPSCSDRGEPSGVGSITLARDLKDALTDSLSFWRVPYASINQVVLLPFWTWFDDPDDLVVDASTAITVASPRWRSKGWSDAADNMKRYLSGQGGEVRVSRDDLVRFEHVARAEQANNNRFIENTFRGRDSDDKIERDLPRLREGDPPYIFNDHWDTDLGTLGLGWQELAGDRNFARAYGRNKLKSRGSFSAVRKADLLHIDGEVTHLWNEPYNFENRQPGAVEARALESEDIAAPFGSASPS